MRLWSRLETWQQIGVVVIALLGAGWSANATIMPILDQVASNTKWIQMQQFDRLQNTRCFRKLTQREYNRFCFLGQALGYFRRGCPRNTRIRCR